MDYRHARFSGRYPTSRNSPYLSRSRSQLLSFIMKFSIAPITHVILPSRCLTTSLLNLTHCQKRATRIRLWLCNYDNGLRTCKIQRTLPTNFPPTHPIFCLGPNHACHLSKQVFDNAITELDTVRRATRIRLWLCNYSSITWHYGHRICKIQQTNLRKPRVKQHLPTIKFLIILVILDSRHSNWFLVKQHLPTSKFLAYSCPWFS